ncbi:MAG: periplasmic heavy metal sensor [Deltaproteobacteria bacterium]|nr:MAG: periplasmic heavy metal sensor [Deltaproteobacteria bacterium]
MKRFILPVLILAPLAMAGAAIANNGDGAECRRGGPMGHHRGGPPVEMLASTLELDEAQTAELTALLDGFRGTHDERRAAHDAFRDAAVAELTADAPDFAKLEALATAEAEAAHARHLEGIGLISDFAASLTPEQRALLAEHLEAGPPPHPHFGKR